MIPYKVTALEASSAVTYPRKNLPWAKHYFTEATGLIRMEASMVATASTRKRMR